MQLFLLAPELLLLLLLLTTAHLFFLLLSSSHLLLLLTMDLKQSLHFLFTSLMQLTLPLKFSDMLLLLLLLFLHFELLSHFLL